MTNVTITLYGYDEDDFLSRIGDGSPESIFTFLVGADAPSLFHVGDERMIDFLGCRSINGEEWIEFQEDMFKMEAQTL